MKALVGAFNQEKALVGAFSVIVQPVVEPIDRFTALVRSDEAAAAPRPAAGDGGARAHHARLRLHQVLLTAQPQAKGEERAAALGPELH